MCVPSLTSSTQLAMRVLLYRLAVIVHAYAIYDMRSDCWWALFGVLHYHDNRADGS